MKICLAEVREKVKLVVFVLLKSRFRGFLLFALGLLDARRRGTRDLLWLQDRELLLKDP
jgi:hypothetical protein